MNLYKVISVHYAPKDFHSAIERFIVADSDEKVLENLKKKEYEAIDECIEEYELDASEVWNQIFEDKGELDFQEEVDGYSDLHYGKTFYRWELVTSDLEDEEINFLLNTLDATLVN